jgi:hypothetical protein
VRNDASSMDGDALGGCPAPVARGADRVGLLRLGVVLVEITYQTLAADLEQDSGVSVIA